MTQNTQDITQRLLELSPRPAMKLSEITRLIRKHRIVVPTPSRPTLIALCECGVFETVGNAPTRFGWLVYEDSFLRWVESLSGGRADKPTPPGKYFDKGMRGG